MSARRRISAGGSVIGLAVCLLAAGCAMVGPDYEAPTASIKAEWAGFEDPQLSTEPVVDPMWWRSAFGDPVLDELIEEALAGNLSLRSAGLRVLQAQQAFSIATGTRLPQQQAVSGSASSTRLSNNALDYVPLLHDTFTSYSLGFNLAWEVDFWGRFRRLVDQAAAQLDASVAEYDDAMVTLISGVAQTYLLIRTLQQRLLIAEENIALQTESVEVTRAKFEGGATSELDLDQAQTLLSNTQASVASLSQALRQMKNNLAVLLGKPPGELDVLLEEAGTIPSVAPEIAIGMPQNLIRRRPDIRSLERQLAAQSAQVGISTAELYPQFVLGGNVGLSTNTNDSKVLSDLFDTDSLSRSVLGSFQWDIFNYGRLKASIRLQDAVFQQLLEDYRETVLQAQAEVENAIAAYLYSLEQSARYAQAASFARRAADIAIAQYEDGLIDFTPVLVSLRSLASQLDIQAATEGQVATNLVAVYKSLGGGWEVRGSQNAVDLLPDSTRDEMLERLPKRWNKVLAE